jgi:SAM-dependent methyltransferase
VDQQRWDQYGADRLAALSADPGRFVVTRPPYAHSADIVVGLAVLHHLSQDDLASALAETHRVLRPGGRCSQSPWKTGTDPVAARCSFST